MPVLLSLLLAAAPIAPAPPAPASQAWVDPSAIKAAGRVLDAMGYDSMIKDMSDRFAAQFGPEMSRMIEERTGKAPNPKMIDEIAAAQSRFLRDFTTDPKLRDATELLYARHFTVAELDRMAVLLADPAMQAWNKRTPAVMAEFMPLVVRQMAAKRVAFEAELAVIVGNYGVDLTPGETHQ